MTITETEFRRVVTPARFLPEWHKTPITVYVTIDHRFELNQKWELSLQAVEGPKTNGNAIGGCGQSTGWADEPTMQPLPGWTRPMVRQLIEVWGRWHLNGMRAGSPAQEAWLRDHPVNAVYPESHYEKAGAALAAAGLNPDPNYLNPHKTRERVVLTHANVLERTRVADVPYRYGHGWLYEAVPADVLQWLYDLPNTIKPHPWGDTDTRY